jgi:hypothetical protein
MSNLHDTFGIGLSTYASYLAGNYVEEGQYTYYWALFTVNVRRAALLHCAVEDPSAHRPTVCHPSQAHVFTYRPHACCQVMIATSALVAFGWADFYHERKALRVRVDSEPTLPVKQ